jgi:putative sterol carrier protein
MTVADDIQEILSKMPEAFVPEKAANIDAVIQLELTGEGGGQWTVKIASGTLAIDEGQAVSPNLSLSMAATDYVALSMGEANAMGLFMAGKIKVQGDVMLAMKFQEMFDPDRVDR